MIEYDDLPDHYAALQISRTATHDEIRTAWRALARKWHPDRNPGNAEAEQTFKSCSAAWNTLSDLERRQAYDREWDQQEAERAARARMAPCESCGEPAVYGLRFCLRCGIIERLHQQRVRNDRRRAREAEARSVREKEEAERQAEARRTKRRRGPKKAPRGPTSYAMGSEPVEPTPDPDFYDDVIGDRTAAHYAAGTGNLDGDSLLEVLMSEASIRYAFEGTKKPVGTVAREGSSFVFADGQGSQIRLHIDPDALRDLGKNLKTAERLLRTIRRLFG